MNRFNGTELHPMIDGSAENAEMYNIGQLFDNDFFLPDPDFRKKLAVEFVDKVMDCHTKLSLSDNVWFAKVGCVGSLNGKKANWSLYLTRELYDNGVARWVISQAEGSIFKLKPDNGETLPVNADDNGFIPLSIILDNHPKNVANMLADSASTNTVDVFAAMTYCGALKMNYVDTTEFVFCQVPGFIFNVSMTEHKDSNSGWLITDMRTATDKEKEDYLNYVYNGVMPSIKVSHRKEKKVVTLDNEASLALVMQFISGLNAFISDRSAEHYKGLRNIADGRYSFRAAGLIAHEVSKKSEESTVSGRYDFDEFVSGFGQSRFKKIRLCNEKIVEDQYINEQYRGRFKIVEGLLEASDAENALSENVCIFVYGDQIAAILPAVDVLTGNINRHEN